MGISQTEVPGKALAYSLTHPTSLAVLAQVFRTPVRPSNLVPREGVEGVPTLGQMPQNQRQWDFWALWPPGGRSGCRDPGEGEPLQPLWAQAGVSLPPKPARSTEACEESLRPVLCGHWEGP